MSQISANNLLRSQKISIAWAVVYLANNPINIIFTINLCFSGFKQSDRFCTINCIYKRWKLRKRVREWLTFKENLTKEARGFRAVAQLAEQLLPKAEVHGSNTDMCNILYRSRLYRWKDEKKEDWGREWPIIGRLQSFAFYFIDHACVGRCRRLLIDRPSDVGRCGLAEWRAREREK